MFRQYINLTKPGIIFSNVLTAVGGFFLAEKGHFSLGLFLAMGFGLGFVIASACVFNNYIDKGIDSKMARTKKRALVSKRIPETHALVFGTILGILGFLLLLGGTNLQTALVAFVGFFFYVVLYSLWKRKSEFGTVVGSVSGAVPPVVGYVAVTNQVDLAALLLFLILVFWQMPHFYSIALFRSTDYEAASIPVLPLTRGITHTKVQMLLYIIAFTITASLLTVFHYTGLVYFAGMLILGVVWFIIAVQGFKKKEYQTWSRKLFYFSLLIIVLFSGMLLFNKLLP